jgi:hypothetical protein
MRLRNSERSWFDFSCLVMLSTVATAIAASLLAVAALPPNVGGDILLLNVYTRMESVLSNSLSSLDTRHCILILGDSRAAMNINAAHLGRPDCTAINLAFPALGIPPAVEFINAAAKRKIRPNIEIALLVASEIVFTADPLRADLTQSLQDWWSVRPIRLVAIGWLKIGALWQGMATKPGRLFDGVDWNGGLGRWQMAAGESRNYSVVPNLQSAIADHVHDYYVIRSYKNIEPKLDQFVTAAKRVAKKVAVVLPPSFPGVIEAADRVAPGVMETFSASVRTAAKKHDLVIIDCVDPASCDLRAEHFADPVHLNADGAAAFTRYLSTVIQP